MECVNKKRAPVKTDALFHHSLNKTTYGKLKLITSVVIMAMIATVLVTIVIAVIITIMVSVATAATVVFTYHAT